MKQKSGTVYLHLRKDGDAIGHMMMEIIDETSESQVVGFGPAGDGVKRVWGPGTLNRAQDRQAVEEGRTTRSRPIQLSKEQTSNLVRKVRSDVSETEDYSAVTNNCVDYVMDSLRSVGVETKDLDLKFPEGNLREYGAAGAVFEKRTLDPSDPARAAKETLETIKKVPDRLEQRGEEEMLNRFVPPELRGMIGPGASLQPEEGAKPEEMPAEIKSRFTLPETDQARYKQPAHWTEDEARSMQAAVMRMPAGSPEREQGFARTKAFYDHAYGTDPVKYDATGRMIQPMPRVKLPTQPRPARTPDGFDLAEAAQVMAKQVASAGPSVGAPQGQGNLPGGPAQGGGAAGGSSWGDVISMLQKGLNIAFSAYSLKQTQKHEKEMAKLYGIEEDGKMGPQTQAALFEALATHGLGAVEEAFALGRVEKLAEKTSRTGRVEGNLAQEMDRITRPLFGPLEDDQKPPMRKLPVEPPPQLRPRPEFESFQDSLNGALRRPSGEPLRGGKLKLDGDIGPKTTEAFELAVRRVKPRDLALGYGRALGLLS